MPQQDGRWGRERDGDRSQAGFGLEGGAFVLVDAVVAGAAATFDPARATGLDGALRAVAAEPHDAWVVVAVGLAAFSVYCLARARPPVGWERTSLPPTARRLAAGPCGEAAIRARPPISPQQGDGVPSGGTRAVPR